MLTHILAATVVLCQAPNQPHLKAQPEPARVRFAAKIHDAAGAAYEVRLISRDETITTEKYIGGGWEEGDKKASGHYEVTCLRVGGTNPGARKRSICPVGGGDVVEFRLKEKPFYIIRGKVPAEPDLLVIEVHLGQRANSVHAFYVRNGSLRTIRFKAPKEPVGNTCEVVCRSFHRVGFHRYKTYVHWAGGPPDNATWRFKPSEGLMVKVKSEH